MADTHAGRTLREITRIVASRFIGMVIIFAVVIAAVWAATHYAPREYRSELPLLAEPEQPVEILPRPAAASLREKIALFVSTQEAIIKSDYVLASGLLQLKAGALLPERPVRKGRPAPAAQAQADEQPPQKDKDEPDYRAKLDQWQKDLEEKWQPLVETYLEEQGREVEQARRRVTVVTPGGPDVAFNQVFKIRVDWPEERDEAAVMNVKPRELAAQRAPNMARYVLDAYRARYVQLERKKAAEEVWAYEGPSFEVVKDGMKQAEADMKAFLGGLTEDEEANLLHLVNVAEGSGLETGIAAMVRDTAAKIENIKAEEAELTYYIETSISPQTTKAKDLLEPIEKDFDAVERPIATGDVEGAEEQLKDVVERIRIFNLVVPDDASAASSSLRSIQERTTVLRLKLDEYTTSYKYMHESVRYTARELLNVWKTLGREMTAQEQKAKDKRGKLQAGREAKELWLLGEKGAKKGGMKGLLGRLTTLAVEYDLVASRLKSLNETYNEALKKKIEAETRSRQAQSPILAIAMDAPTRPDPARPRRPILWLNILIAVIAGFILAVIYAFMADHFDHTIKGIDDAERYLGTPVLVSIPKLGHRIVRTT